MACVHYLPEAIVHYPGCDVNNPVRESVYVGGEAPTISA